MQYNYNMIYEGHFPFPRVQVKFQLGQLECLSKTSFTYLVAYVNGFLHTSRTHTYIYIHRVTLRGRHTHRERVTWKERQRETGSCIDTHRERQERELHRLRDTHTHTHTHTHCPCTQIRHCKLTRCIAKLS